MNKQQSDILNSFLIEFLPPQGNKRKSSNNEFITVFDTLKPIFSKFFEIKITRQELWDALDELGYNFIKRELAWDTERKDYKPVNKHSNIISIHSTSGDNEMFKMDGHYNINLSATQVKNLRLTVSGLPPSTSIEKLKLKEELIDNIQTFINGKVPQRSIRLKN